MFVVVQGGFHGFIFNGLFESYGDATRWLLLQNDAFGEVVALVMPKGFLKTGQFILVVGDVYNGFKITGTFSSHRMASVWQDVRHLWGTVVTLQCP